MCKNRRTQQTNYIRLKILQISLIDPVKLSSASCSFDSRYGLSFTNIPFAILRCDFSPSVFRRYINSTSNIISIRFSKFESKLLHSYSLFRNSRKLTKFAIDSNSASVNKPFNHSGRYNSTTAFVNSSSFNETIYRSVADSLGTKFKTSFVLFSWIKNESFSFNKRITTFLTLSLTSLMCPRRASISERSD